MGKLYVTDGTEFSCAFCSKKLKLLVTESFVSSESHKNANMTNCLIPPPAGGQCTLIPTAPVPCTAGAKPVSPGQSSVEIGGALALVDGCQFMCPKGPPLTVSKVDQSSVMTGASADSATSSNNNEANKQSDDNPSSENKGTQDASSKMVAAATPSSAKNEWKKGRNNANTEETIIKMEPPCEPKCFKPGKELLKSFKDDRRKLAEEFCRQLKDQEAGINQLTVSEYLANREKYISLSDEHGHEKARKIIGANKVQNSVRSEFEGKVSSSIAKTLVEKKGVSSREADSIALEQSKKKLSTLAALHDPDMVAGGHHDRISRMGDTRVNSSLGSQWTHQNRLDNMDYAANNALDRHGPDAKMNVKLQPCRTWG